MRRRRSDDPYYNGSEFSESEDYYADYPLQRSGQHNMQLEKEEDLVTRAHERIARARALGKTNVKLSQPEIDALERLERTKVPQKISQPPAKPSPASKKKGKQKTIEAGKKKRGDSPKARPVEGRARNRSNASSRSARDDRDELVSYPLPQDPDYGYIGRATDPRAVPYQGSPLRPGGSRSNSSSNIRQMGGGPPMYAPYYPGQRYISMPEGFYHRRGESTPSRLRADSALSGPRSRSGSIANTRDIPLDQLPNPTQAGRAPRFDPLDPRYASPGRRVVSGSYASYGPPPPQAGITRRQSDDMFLQEGTEVLDYLASGSSRSNSDSDGSYYDRPVEVNVQEKPGSKTGYAIKTRSAAAASGSKSASKSNAKASIRRR